MKLLAIVVTYFPEINELIQNISSYIDDVDELIVWENTPSGNISYKRDDILSVCPEKILFKGVGENAGIGTALNAGVNYGVDNSFTHLITFDQDSYFEEGELKKYKQIVDDSEKNNLLVGIFAPNYCQNNKFEYPKSDVISIQSECITSGAIISRVALKNKILFDETLFIDCVDFEYCYRLKRGYDLETAICSNVILNHQVGYVQQTIWGFKTENYSAFRTYFIVRNTLIIWRAYPSYFPKHKKYSLVKNQIILRICKVLLAESDKWNKIKAIFIGVYHALIKKTGYYCVK